MDPVTIPEIVHHLHHNGMETQANMSQLHFQLPDDGSGWNPRAAIEQFIIPDEYLPGEIPKPSKLKSPLYDFGVKVVRKDNGHMYWFCCASKHCYERRVIISIRKSTSMATQHLQHVHGLPQSEKRGPRRLVDGMHDSGLFAVR